MSQIFREQDAVRDVQGMHPSFRRKAPVENQISAAASRMESQPGVRLSTVNDSAPQPVPTTWDTKYDPNHPNADWSGSYQVAERAHYSGHRSMEGHIDQRPDGFIANQEQPMWSSKRRGQAVGGLNSTPGLIGGIGVDNSSDQYRSVARAQSERDNTSFDQYTLAKRNVQAGRRNLSNPAQNALKSKSTVSDTHNNRVRFAGEENSQYGNGEISPEEEAAFMAYHQAQQQQSTVPVAPVKESLLGFKGPAQTMSLTSSLAASIAGNINMAAPSGSGFVPKHAYKDLANENKPIPGYTGYRHDRSVGPM